MKRTYLTMLLVVAGAALIGAGFFLGRQTGQEGEHAVASHAVSSTHGRKVLYWHDPMVPGPRFDKPGKSPFMDMQLVPMYADSAPSESGVKVSPTVKQNLGIRFSEVRSAEASSSFDAKASVQFD